MLNSPLSPFLYWLYQPYKWLIFIPLMLVNSIVFATLAALFSLAVSSAAGSFMGRCWARITCWITPIRVFVSGNENIKKNKSYIIVSNHQTGFDIFLLYRYNSAVNIKLPIDSLYKRFCFSFGCKFPYHYNFKNSSADYLFFYF